MIPKTTNSYLLYSTCDVSLLEAIMSAVKYDLYAEVGLWHELGPLALMPNELFFYKSYSCCVLGLNDLKIRVSIVLLKIETLRECWDRGRSVTKAR